MRSAVLGVAIEDEAELKSFVRASTRLTHTDPKAEYGALAIALAARESAHFEQVDSLRWLDCVKRCLGEEGHELLRSLRDVVESVQRGESTRTFCDAQGLQRGVTGYVYHTVPACIHAWLRNPGNLGAALTEIIECAGDADTTAAIVGGIVGAGVGNEGVPEELKRSLAEWPRPLVWMQQLGVRLSEAQHNTPSRAPELNPVCTLLRNVLFLVVVLIHGFRRLGPPY